GTDLPEPTTEETKPATALTDTFEIKDQSLSEGGLLAALPFAFLGGLILNVMPCVLPVIALKAMSFAKQAGESRATVLKLNLWYAAGVLSVFLVFAGLTLGLGAFLNVETFGWGDQVNSNTGKVFFTALVFVLGLSMLGLFEIPVPGLVGDAAGKAGQKEGASGAFLGGIITTLLATPCTGPFIGAAGGFAVSLADSNPLGAVALWATMGLGFASPYLLIAVIPGATQFLPKPGDWMVWFKELGGLLLLGTAIWLLQGVRPYELWLPILVGLLGLATGLWIVGRLIRHNDSPNRKYALRLAALGVSGAVLAFAASIAPEGGLNAAYDARLAGGTATEAEELWEPFDSERLNELRAEGKTVLVDFRSTVCPSCDYNEKVVLDTALAHQAYDELGIVTMKGVVDLSEDAQVWLKKLGGFGVPHIAVFPGDRPNEPDVHNGTITAATFYEMLEKATGRKFDPDAAPSPADRTAENADGWEALTAERLDELRGDGRNAVLFFDASYSLSSDLNEQIALDTEVAREVSKQLGFVKLKGSVDLSSDAKELFVGYRKDVGFDIPHLVIIPGERPDQPLQHNGKIAQTTFVELLEEAAGKEPAPSENDSTREPVRTASR
ncbi:MAG: cytochrome c biogenesis protein CcdA, partial [Planctomycetota bacterium]